MKNMISLFFIGMTLSFSIISYSHDQDSIMCKQKESPVDTELVSVGIKKEIKIKFRKKLSSFTVLNVRGLDGLKVTHFDLKSIDDVQIGEEVLIPVTLDQQSGLQYLVLDYKFKKDGKDIFLSATMPVGKISSAQLKKRSSNIKTQRMNRKKHTGATGAGQQSKDRKVHLMKLE